MQLSKLAIFFYEFITSVNFLSQLYQDLKDLLYWDL